MSAAVVLTVVVITHDSDSLVAPLSVIAMVGSDDVIYR
ncbi:hypothetical protein Ptr902_08854 [Pyrenophora tritici-repentis]|uniref:Uncharacterized protein n=1 Tax=Pyrenophora tritici-repentis TaxID=45151 RepID=A0A5M9LTN2_9PLEO|nr:hypothetical protein PtrV1_03102 [Pyrenophora tritici-repentis]KAF7442542.1 hypothetical protein A1F99_134110 [Pyrenophora tritici-repentis]KAF7579082.1 hypothetical protein PtrM4_033220 [Pyrenophora tritici-repentis]KAI0569954.1 hypothetical protein Alg130_11419 [Pyrenophora tritici-repentis]KAI0574867.1 hypothetical protein Alg215_08356 [Pyrenophora tritici-repentis]